MSSRGGTIMSSSSFTAPAPRFSTVATQPGSDILNVILKIAATPNVISFAGGLPAPEGFPVAQLAAACQTVLDRDGKRALQYSAIKGEKELREEIARRETEKGIPTTADEVQIVSGSQQALDIIARIFLNPGDKVLVESPTYLGALQAFDLCRPSYTELACDEQGLNPVAFGDECKDAKFAYVIPTCANPTGLTMSHERREVLAQKARQYDMWLIEDDPYGEIWYVEEPPMSLRAYAPERTIRLGTLSKILTPGFRLGYVIAPKEVLDMIVKFKGAMDLNTCTFTQLVSAQVFSEDILKTHLPAIRERYKKHADAMLEALEEFMPEGVTWTHPIGGMFIWVTFPECVNTTELLPKALEQQVGFVPGEAFYANNPKRNHMRLSFVTVGPEKIREGIKRISEIVKLSL